MGNLASNLRVSINAAWYYVVVYSVLAVLLTVIRGPGLLDQYGLSIATLVAVYVVGGLAAGALVGLLLPLCKYKSGAALTGFVAVLPICTIVILMVAPRQRWNEVIPLLPILMAALYGILGGLFLHGQSSR